MRYFTIEQRESLRDALINRAALLRENLSRKRSHGARGVSHAQRRDDRSAEPIISFGPAEEQSTQLRKLEETLVKLRSPEYGVCEDCSGDIAYALLRDDPLATLCRQCRQRKALASFVPNEL